MISSQTRELFRTYVAPYVWDGFMWADGGWGPKNGILALADVDLLHEQKRPVFLSPHNERRSSRATIQGDTRECSVDTDERWRVSLAGEAWPQLLELIEDVRKLGVAEQRWTLTSHFSTQRVDIDRPIYRMIVVAKEKEADVRIIQGSWKPSFDRSRPVAGWGLPV